MLHLISLPSIKRTYDMKTPNRRTPMLTAVATLMASLQNNMSEIGMLQLREANSEYINSARGKGKGGGLSATRIFSKHTNWKAPHQGAKECQRRVAQGNAGKCYVHGAQYNPSLAGM